MRWALVIPSASSWGKFMSAAVIDERTAAPRVIPDGLIPSVPIVRLSVAAYHRMLDAGILQSGDPIELLAGWLVPISPKGPRHTTVLAILAKWLERSCGRCRLVRRQDPITTDDSEPEPDIAVVTGQLKDFARRHPASRKVELVIEVAQTSLMLDRGLKAELYAEAEIPQYWIVNLNEDVIEVHTRPNPKSHPPSYGERRVYGLGETIPVVLRETNLGALIVDDVLRF